MSKTVFAACAAILLITLQCETCYSLKTINNVKNVISDHDRIVKPRPEDFLKFTPSWQKKNNEKDLLHKNEAPKRVVRQAYQGQTSIYPNVPSGPPYGLEPYPNTRPGNNLGPYGQNSQSNSWQHNGQPSYNNQYGTNSYTQPGYSNTSVYTPSNFNNNPSGPYGQYTQRPQSNQWMNNGQQPNYNNQFGTNPQSGHYNYSQTGYPASNDYKPSNFSPNPSGPYGHTTPPNSWQNPYSNNNNQRPYGNNGSNPYPGYQPNMNNIPSGRPPYNQAGQSYNNSHHIYPIYDYITTLKPISGIPIQRPPYYPGQSQTNNTGIRYDDSTRRPGQNPYNNYNNTYGRQPYNTQNGQSPYPFQGSAGYGQQNTNTPYGQYSPNNYPGSSSNAATFNLANSGYNPSIPNSPPYGSPYGNGPYGNSSPNQSLYPNGTLHDPTRVSPQFFNSN